MRNQEPEQLLLNLDLVGRIQMLQLLVQSPILPLASELSPFSNEVNVTFDRGLQYPLAASPSLQTLTNPHLKWDVLAQ
jgi:hypothetical protein